ncbi:homoserine kinase [Anaeramoeba flamelloides]|uniref:Homoserine kinase n=1 Tax=Anaeramoeba flamelloides TaxID=1746091 RepID=A0AAV7ZKS5_9EUKA|nr:homoserine kinase [Anaeramoeba flamelloides]
MYTKITLETINRLTMVLYGFEVVSFKRLGGNANSNYKLVSKKGKNYFLKICDEKTLEDLEFWVSYLNYMKTNNFETSFPIKLSIQGEIPEKTKVHGEYIIQTNLDSKWVLLLLFDFLEGKSPNKENVTNKTLKLLGERIAKMHSIDLTNFYKTCELELPVFAMGIPQMLPFFEKMEKEQITFPKNKKLQDFVPYLRNAAKQISPLVHEIDKSVVPFSLVHADIFLDNCILSNDQSTIWIVDYEEICYQPMMLDLGMALVGTCISPQDNKLDIEKCESLLSGYINERTTPLQENEINRFNHFFIYSALSIAFWRFRQWCVLYPNTSETRTNSFLEMTQLIEIWEKEQSHIVLQIIKDCCNQKLKN